MSKRDTATVVTAGAAPSVTPTTLVVVNPAAGSGRTRRRWRKLVDRLGQLGVNIDLQLTTARGDGIRITRTFVNGGGRQVIVLGGDGTLSEVVAGCVAPEGDRMLADDIVISVVHQGTGGDLARGLDIPRNAQAALAVAVAGSELAVDVCVAHLRDEQGASLHRGFISCANVGLGADVVARVEGRFKRLGDTAGFAVGTIYSLARNRPRRVQIELGSERHDVDIVDVIVANNRYLGGGMLAAPMADIADGQLDVIIVSAASKLRLLRTFPKIYKGTHIDSPLVRWERVPALTVEASDQPQGVVLDGELVGQTPVAFTVLPGALRIRVP